MNANKKVRKIASLFFTLAFLLSLVACTPQDSSSSNNRESMSEVPDDAWYKDLDFGGEFLTVSMSINLWDPGATMDSQSKYTKGPEDVGADTVLNACYARNREVTNLLNLNIKYVETDYPYNEINSYIDSAAVMSKAPADLIVNDVFAVVPAMLKGQLYNLKDKAEQNYFDFEHRSWYSDFINGLTYDSSRVYAVAGDYFIDVIRSSHVLFVNTEIFQIQLSEYYPEMKDFYNMILDGEWDYDEYMLLIQEGWKSTSGEPHANEKDEYIGLWGRPSPFGPVYSANVSMVEKTNGGYQMKENTAELQEFAEAFSDLYQTDGVYVHPSGTTNRYVREKFVEGKILFMEDFLLGELELPAMLGMEKKAPVVYPKWKEDAEYSTWVHDSAEIGYILMNTASFTPTSAYLQLLNEASEPIMTEYYEHTLKFGKNTDPDVLKVLDLIRDVIIPPFEQYLSGVSIATLVWPVVTSNNPAAVVTSYSSNQPTYVQKLAEKLNQFYLLED